MTHMLPDDVRCRDCGHVGPARRARTEIKPHANARPDGWWSSGLAYYVVDVCESCWSESISTRAACVHCGLRDATDDDYCHTCAVAIETTDVLCASRAGIERISDLHATIRECARGLR